MKSFGKKLLFSVLALVSGTTVAFSQSTTNSGSSDFESERKTSFIELGYYATSFDDVKLSGHYGLSYTILPWKIADRFYGGIHFSPFNFNFGLVSSDFTTDEIKLGPAFGYYFTPKIAFAIPLNVICSVYFDEKDNAKTQWGMEIAPTLYLGKKCGIYFGPLATTCFESGSEFDFGFKAGLYF